MSFRPHVSRPVRRRIRRLTATLLAAYAAAHALAAGQPPAPAQGQPTFRTGVQVIEVDVRVFDREGRFIRDLLREDFEIIEDGAAQEVREMYLVGQQQIAAGPASLLPTSAATSSPVSPQTWIFVFDLNHLTSGSGFDRARKAVEDFVRDRFREGDLAGVVAGDRMVNNRITSVRSELVDAVKSIKPRDDSRSRQLELTRDWPRLLNEEEAVRIARAEDDVTRRAMIRACSDDADQCNFAETAVREKGRRLAGDFLRAAMATMTSLNALASGLSRMPGPKTVVLLTDGFVVQEVETTLRSVVGQAARAGARVYAIDVRGANRDRPGGNVEQMQAVDEAGPVTKFDSVADGPNSLAVDTGGIMIRNENNFGRALDRVADDAGLYYVLGYQPQNANFDGKFRRIQVRVKRAGTRVRARRGYLALEPSRLLKPQPQGSTPPADTTSDAPASAALPAAPTGTEAAPNPASTASSSTVPAIVGTPTVATEGTVRIRPDAESRVKALSTRDASAAGSELARAGWDAYERGDVESAHVSFTAATQKGDARPWVYYALGMTQAALNKPTDAIQSWELVRESAPDFESVYMDLADTYAQTAQWTKALAVARDAEKRWPDNAEVQSAIGVIHVRRGALDEGIASLTKVTQLTPDDALAHLNLGRAYAQRYHRGRRFVTSQRRWVAPEGDRQKAMDAFRRAIEIGGPYAQRARDELSALEWIK